MRIITLSAIDLPGNMFDGVVDSQTEIAGQIQVTFPVAGKNAVAILNTAGYEATLELPDAVLIVDLVADAVKDWWDYWFAPRRFGRDTVFYFPTQAAGAQARLTIHADGDAACGLCVTGFAAQYGWTKAGVSIGIEDFSRIDINQYGQSYLKVGRYAKRLEAPLKMRNRDFDRLYTEITGLAGTAAIFDYNDYSQSLETLHTSQAGKQALLVYGFTDDFYQTLEGPCGSSANHDVQGLT